MRQALGNMTKGRTVTIDAALTEKLAYRVRASQRRFLTGGLNERFALLEALAACVSFVEAVAPATKSGVLEALQSAMFDRAVGIDEPAFGNDAVFGKSSERLPQATARARAGLVTCVDYLVAEELAGTPISLPDAFRFVEQRAATVGLRKRNGNRFTAKDIAAKRAELQKDYAVRSWRLSAKSAPDPAMPAKRAHALSVELTLINARKRATFLLVTMNRQCSTPRQTHVADYMALLRASVPANVL